MLYCNSFHIVFQCKHLHIMSVTCCSSCALAAVVSTTVDLCVLLMLFRIAICKTLCILGNMIAQI